MGYVRMKRRPFDPNRDAERFVFLLDERAGTLFEVVAVKTGDAAPKNAGENIVKVLDVAHDLPDDPFDALDVAEWLPLKRAACLAVVVPDRDDG